MIHKTLPKPEKFITSEIRDSHGNVIWDTARKLYKHFYTQKLGYSGKYRVIFIIITLSPLITRIYNLSYKQIILYHHSRKHCSSPLLDDQSESGRIFLALIYQGIWLTPQHGLYRNPIQ